MELKHVVVARPGGNDTALVFDDVNPGDYKEVNAYIQTKKPEIEQVMFVRVDQPMPKGIMAGGEFCGNATRSLGYYLLKGEDGSIDLSISGASAPLNVKVKNKSANTRMPIINDASSVQYLTDMMAVVRLEGITHLVLESASEPARKMRQIENIEQKKFYARKLLTEHNLQEEAASGVMCLADKDGLMVLEPFVYVKSINTFYAETACGSGSVAVGLVLAKRRSASVYNQEIRQPSGQSIFVDVDFSDNYFEGASIAGGVEIVSEGPFD